VLPDDAKYRCGTDPDHPQEAGSPCSSIAYAPDAAG
jgi:hypothetical protein